MTAEVVSDIDTEARIAVGRARSCGSCILNPQVVAFANGGDAENCRGPQSFERTEMVSYGSHSAPYTEDGFRCPTYQSGGDGHIEYAV